MYFKCKYYVLCVSRNEKNQSIIRPAYKLYIHSHPYYVACSREATPQIIISLSTCSSMVRANRWINLIDAPPPAEIPIYTSKFKVADTRNKLTWKMFTPIQHHNNQPSSKGKNFQFEATFRDNFLIQFSVLLTLFEFNDFLDRQFELYTFEYISTNLIIDRKKWTRYLWPLCTQPCTRSIFKRYDFSYLYKSRKKITHSNKFVPNYVKLSKKKYQVYAKSTEGEKNGSNLNASSSTLNSFNYIRFVSFKYTHELFHPKKNLILRNSTLIFYR